MIMDYRLLGAFATSLVLTLFFLPRLIEALKKFRYSQRISEYSLDEYKAKKETPTMGGISFVIIPSIVFVIFFYPQWNQQAFMILYVVASYALIGGYDDYKIITEGKNDGLSARFKFALQALVTLIFYLLFASSLDSVLTIPGINLTISLGLLYPVLIFFMLNGASNGVNITDGMDGLAGGTMVIALSAFLVIAIFSQQWIVAGFLSALLGSLLGYLRFNIYPAQIIMGDIGSLPLGAILALVAILLKQEILLVVIGGVFVYETLCVIIQIGSVVLFKRRVFRYTPIHYSFVLSGWKETKVVYFFWVLGLVAALSGLGLWWFL